VKLRRKFSVPVLGQRRKLILDRYMSEVPDIPVFRIEERISVTLRRGALCPDNHFANNSKLIVRIGEAVSETKRAFGETNTVGLIISLCARKTHRNYLAPNMFCYLTYKAESLFASLYLIQIYISEPL
jgi:hypothetical protein